ncbi:MAG: dihydrolipoamide acyltransferase [Bacteroidetes bacterium]|nr:MAG: dihydrolipoamide acyltransferase [Bacteroidota bacterium]
MAEVVKMPKLSDTMTEGVLVKWFKKAGDAVKSGEILAEIETDKATMEFESFYDGILLHIGIKEGETAPVDTIIAIIGKKGEKIDALLKEEKKTVKKEENQPDKVEEKVEVFTDSELKPVASITPPPPPPPPLADELAKPIEVTSSQNGLNLDGIKASPLARKLAIDNQISLNYIKGSGDDGRIVKRDIEAYIKSGTAVQFVGKESFDEVGLSQMRKTIARRLAESKFSAPHFYLTMEINMDQAIDARKGINDFAPVKISYNDLIIKAVTASLRDNPKVNSSWLGDRIRYNHHIHIGVAIAVEDGLLVPVIKFADGKTLSQISIEVKNFAEKAKSKKLQPEEMEGNTFTISNLGMFGIEEFTAIVNPIDSCILAVGSIKQTAVVKNGNLVPGNVMKVTLSCDHRVVDGVKGSLFLQTLRDYLENPYKLLTRGTV